MIAVCVHVLHRARAERHRRPGRPARRVGPPAGSRLHPIGARALAGQLRRGRAAGRVDAGHPAQDLRAAAARCTSSGTLLAGILLFFVLEKLVLWRHCHTHDCEVHDGSVVPVLVGDAFHNFVDGAVIAAAVMTSIPLGVSTAVAVAAHEIPQELGDFAILLHSGYSRRRAMLLNVLSAGASAVGAVAAFVGVRRRAEAAALLPGARRRQLPLRGDGRSDPGPAPRPHRRQLAAPDCPHRAPASRLCCSCRAVLFGRCQSAVARPVTRTARPRFLTISLRIPNVSADPGAGKVLAI